jgi:hypothetical protein
MTAGAATPVAGETARRVACLAGPAVIAAVIAFDALLIWIGLQRPQSSPWLLAVVIPDSVIAPAVGLLIVRRHPRHPVGWLLIAHGPLVAVLLGNDAVTQFMVARHMWPSGIAAIAASLAGAVVAARTRLRRAAGEERVLHLRPSHGR